MQYGANEPIAARMAAQEMAKMEYRAHYMLIVQSSILAIQMPAGSERPWAAGTTDYHYGPSISNKVSQRTLQFNTTKKFYGHDEI